MNDLDDLGLINKTDPSDFLGAVERFPEQVRDAYQRSLSVDRLPDSSGISSIAILGMGGSGISGDVARVVLGEETSLFFQTIKGYDLPSWVGRDTLVFAVSYSGNTEETLAAFEEAGARRFSRMVIVTTGGELAKWGREFDIPIVEIPAGLPPRAAFGYVSIPILGVCQRLGIAAEVGQGIEEAIEASERRSAEWGRETPVSKNLAKQLAQQLFGKVPIIYGSEGIAEVAAYRWKCQLNECSKVPAWWHSFPELNHNEVVGWKELSAVTSSSMALVVLRHEGEHGRIRKRIDVTLPLIEDNVNSVHHVWAGGSTTLARFLDLTYLGDFVSTYLAVAQGVDPATHDVITLIKNKLAEGD